MKITDHHSNVLESFHEGYAEATRRAYRADWKSFTSWCRANEVDPLPASSATVAAFIDALTEHRKPATIVRKMSALSVIHKDHDLDDPTKAREVAVALKRMYRRRGRRQKQARAINLDLRNSMIQHALGNLLGLRDRALLSVAYDIGCRRAELVSILVEDIDRGEDGSGTVLLRKSKTDQEGSGQVRYLAPGTVAAVDAWLDASRIEDGHLFRSVRRGGSVTGPLPPQDVSRIFKRMARDAGVAPDLAKALSGHSTRVGMAQDMATSGIDLAAIMQAGGWKTPAMVARYIERLNARQGAAARLAALQNRSSPP